jgi:hypothetical protein
MSVSFRTFQQIELDEARDSLKVRLAAPRPLLDLEPIHRNKHDIFFRLRSSG